MPCSLGSDVLEMFLALAAVESPSGRERAVADLAAETLRELGLEADEDGSGPEVGSDAGNLYARLPATDGESGTPLFFCSHLDTVPLTAPVRPVVAAGMVTNAEETILGADNKAAVAAMLDAVRQVVERGLPHAGIELVLTTQEETGLLGAKAFDCARLHARTGFVFDHAAPIGGIVTEAPTQYTLFADLIGRAAHAGIAPEHGRSAIVAAARAIVEMRHGRIDDETTSNVGLIEGGTARNVVPERCSLVAEARSLDPAKARSELQAQLDAISLAASASECTAETRIVHEYEAYRYRRTDPIVQLAWAALSDCGYEPELLRTGGGADAHVFNAHGLQCLNLPNGMANIHTADEEIAVGDLHAMVDVTLALIERARSMA